MPKRLFQVKEATLPNGLQVRVVPDHDAPVVSVYTFFRAGSRNERPGITGIAHLFEHMMFNGAKKYGPKEFDRVLESKGGRSNAFTSTDSTVYLDDFATEALETVLDLESDRMRSLALAPKILEGERQVVLEERRSRVDNDIPGMMDEELSSLVFKAHPYRWPIIGWEKDIRNIRRADCLGFFRTYYAPNIATLWICGDVDPMEALRLVRRYYGGIRRGPPPPPVPDAEPPQKGERRAVIHYPAQAPALMISWRGPVARSPDALLLDVVQYVMGAGENSRLNRELVYRQRLATSVGFDWGWRVDAGMLVVFAELQPQVDPAKAEAVIYRELEKLAKEGVGERELTKAKNMIRAHQLRELATNGGRALALGSYELLLGDWREVERIAARYQQITAAQVQEVARRYFEGDQRSAVTLLPKVVTEEVAA